MSDDKKRATMNREQLFILRQEIIARPWMGTSKDPTVEKEWILLKDKLDAKGTVKTVSQWKRSWAEQAKKLVTEGILPATNEHNSPSLSEDSEASSSISLPTNISSTLSSQSEEMVTKHREISTPALSLSNFNVSKNTSSILNASDFAFDNVPEGSDMKRYISLTGSLMNTSSCQQSCNVEDQRISDLKPVKLNFHLPPFSEFGPKRLKMESPDTKVENETECYDLLDDDVEVLGLFVSNPDVAKQSTVSFSDSAPSVSTTSAVTRNNNSLENQNNRTPVQQIKQQNGTAGIQSSFPRYNLVNETSRPSQQTQNEKATTKTPNVTSVQSTPHRRLSSTANAEAAVSAMNEHNRILQSLVDSISGLTMKITEMNMAQEMYHAQQLSALESILKELQKQNAM